MSAGEGQESRADAPADERGGAGHPGGVRTLPYEHHHLSGEGESGQCLHQLLGPALPGRAEAAPPSRRTPVLQEKRVDPSEAEGEA